MARHLLLALVKHTMSDMRRQRCAKHKKMREAFMLYWSLVFLIIAIVAAVLGFGAVAGTAAAIAKVLFWVFLVVFLISLIMGFTSGRRHLP